MKNQLVTLSSVVPDQFVGSSLLDYLSLRFRYHQREAWESRILQGVVSVNDKKTPPDQKDPKPQKVP